MFDPARYQAQIETLRKLDPDCQIFGAIRHRWSFGVKLSVGEIERFEGLFGATLPQSYATYLRECGNGGPGPYYGISSLQIWEVDGSSPSREFVLFRPWRIGNPLPKDSKPHDGCVHLAEIGCGYEAFLVVKGEAAGQVWEDYLAGDGEIAKVDDDFGSWLHKWADHTLRQAVFEAMENALFDPPFEKDPTILEAAAIFEQTFDDKPIAHLERAITATYRGDVEAAKAALAKAEGGLKLDRWKRGRATLAVIHVALGDLAKARELVGGVLQEEKLDFQTRAACSLAMALATEGPAVDEWQVARTSRPFELGLRVRLAIAHLRAGDDAKAQGVLDEAVGEVRLFDGGKTLEGNTMMRAVYERMATLCAVHGLDGSGYATLAEGVPTGPTGWGNPGNTKSW